MKKPEYYKSLQPPETIQELKEWVEEKVFSATSTLRELAEVSEEDGEEIESVLYTPEDELPLIINDYEPNTPGHEILIRRLDLGKEFDVDEFVESDWYAELTHKYMPDLYGKRSQEFVDTVMRLRLLKDIATILADDDLLHKIQVWLQGWSKEAL
jgi:hypothetical protein